MNVNATYGFGQVAHAVCADSGSGISSCTVPNPLNTSSVGTKTITVQAQDRAGHSYSATLSYEVVAGWLYTLTGFFSPVDNLPTVNAASAGSSIPIKFSLGRNWGLNVFAPGSPGVTADDLRRRHGRRRRGDFATGVEPVLLRPGDRYLQVRLEDGAQLAEHLPAAGRPPP